MMTLMPQSCEKKGKQDSDPQSRLHSRLEQLPERAAFQQQRRLDLAHLAARPVRAR